MAKLKRIAICDDEIGTCSDLENMILDFANCRAMQIETEVFYSGEAFYHSILEQCPYDLVFLDIQLLELDGVQVGRQIREQLGNDRISIVYISSKETYAMSLFVWQWGMEGNLRRGLCFNLYGFIISLVTLIVIPSETIWFGILNFMGCAVLLMFPLQKVVKKVSPVWGLGICIVLFVFASGYSMAISGLGTGCRFRQSFIP